MANWKSLTFKKIMGRIHLWSGLITGIVIFVSMTSAAIFVWEKELTNWYHADKVFVPKVKNQTLPFDQIKNVLLTAANGYPIVDFKINRNPGYAYEFLAVAKSENPSWTWASTMDAWHAIYVDQYTGKLLGIVDKRYDWIFCTRMLHQHLLLGGFVGRYVVGIATLVMFVIIISGIVLWWPNNKNTISMRTWFRWKPSTKWRRKNYDIHSIGGVYTCVFILIFGITGLVWTFDWWGKGIYRLLGGNPKRVVMEMPGPRQEGSKELHVYDKIIEDSQSKVDGWSWMSIDIVEECSDLAQPINVAVFYTSGTSGWSERDEYTYNSFTGDLYHSTVHNDRALGDKWRISNYDIHVGRIYGLPTKILACFIALFCGTLPISGFLTWWGRRKKYKGPGTQGVGEGEKDKKIIRHLRPKLKRPVIKQKEEEKGDIPVFDLPPTSHPRKPERR